jgi:hypothetical protein
MKYSGINGQTLLDVCLNTYGSLDFFYKLLQDSSVPSANDPVYTGQAFTWDQNLVVDTQILRTTTLGNIRYATAISGNGSTFAIVIGGGQPLPPNGGGVGPILPPTPTNMYQKTSATTYTATTDDESIITLVILEGKEILQIERNIQPLLPSEFIFNSTSGVITLTNPMLEGESLFILYTEMITI